ncbi:MAG: hypothetical protein IPO07_30965 [Haliscomenobacter sp.]|nr:hypothetical protein [Haliscomenobacter sp.]MBK9492704.1 hypothetical protein [Haliscomenobacter sp.]
MLYDHDFNVIDGTIQKVKGEYVLFLKDETRNPPQKNLRIARSKQLTEGYSAASEPITGKYWAEGPTVLKNQKNTGWCTRQVYREEIRRRAFE